MQTTQPEQPTTHHNVTTNVTRWREKNGIADLEKSQALHRAADRAGKPQVKFGSVCSGIEAASVAWKPLGWEAAWLSEIEPFPSAVLAHHYPDVPNLGDMTTLPERILSGEVEAPDLFCGGTPCQAFSVAGLRNSLDDARGNLSLTFVGIANAIDHVRSIRSAPPAIIFWENVPGVLSTKDNAFGCFLAALAGEDDPIIPSGEKWTNAGCVYGPQRAVAWRVLDAQYFGVAQRRRRVFVVASARADFDPAAVLFEFDGVRRDSAPSRETGQGVAPCVTNGPPFSRNERVEAEAMVVQPVGVDIFNAAFSGDVAVPLTNRSDGTGTGPTVMQPYTVGNTLTARMAKGINSTLDEGQNPIIALQDITPREKAQNGKGWNDDGTAYTVDTHATQGVAQPTYAIQGSMIGRNDNAGPQGDGINEEVCFTQNCVDRHAVAQPIILMDQGGSVMNVEHDMVGTLRRETHGHEPVVAVRMVAFGEYVDDGTASAMKARDYKDATDLVAQTFSIPAIGHIVQDEVASTMTRHTGSGSGETQNPAFVAQPVIVHGTQDPCVSDIAFTQGRNNGGENVLMQPIPLNSMNVLRSADADPTTGCGIGEAGEAMFTITKGNSHAVAQPIALQDVRLVEKAQNGKGWNDDRTAYTVDTHATQGVAQPIGFDSYNHAVTGDVSKTLDVGQDYHHVPNLLQAMQVRRLTPVECERLQGFPDGYTNIPWRKKPEAPDGPRYKALGNSWAVPVVRWIGERIAKAVSQQKHNLQMSLELIK